MWLGHLGRNYLTGNNEWQLIAEYIWGPLGPLMMRRYNPQTQSLYNDSVVQDGLEHSRLLLDGNGNIVNRYTDNLLKQSPH